MSYVAPHAAASDTPRHAPAIRCATAGGPLELDGRAAASAASRPGLKWRRSPLFNTFSEVHPFDLVVAENGAVLHVPADGKVDVLAPGPPPEFVAALQRAGIPLSVGHSMVATVIPHQHFVLQAIRNFGLEWHVIFNKEAVMALPSDVTKATGLDVALCVLNLSPEDVVGIGDAENDHSFLRMCGLSVAVQNALPGLKEDVDFVTNAERGAGVRELLTRLLAPQSDFRNSTRSAF